MSNQIQAQEAATSLLIKTNKQRIQRTIDHYHRVLPPTFTSTKRVISHTKKSLTDIREKEIKNTMFVDPLVSYPIINISAKQEESIKEEAKMYVIPDFLQVSHRKKLKAMVFQAYSKHVNANRKNRNVQGVHLAALEVALKEINSYIMWVDKNNQFLVKEFPEQFSYRNNEVDEIPQVPEEDKVSFIGKIKKMFVN